MSTKIDWAEESWNPALGCTKIAAGCKNCYAEKMARRFWKKWGLLPPPNHFGVKWFSDRLDIPRKWKKQRRIFVCSMSDLFHQAIPFEFIDQVFDTMFTAHQHTYFLLTKRPKAMAKYIKHLDELCFEVGDPVCWSQDPNKHIWLGTSISTQEDADKNIPELLKIPGKKWLSIEPMIEGIDCTNISITEEWLRADLLRNGKTNDEIDKMMHIIYPDGKYHYEGGSKIDWVVVGCESGPKRRPCKLEWIRSIVEQCRAANVPCYVKQVPINGKVSHDPKEWPEDLRVREYPDGSKC